MKKHTIYGIIIITLFIFASGFFITTSMANEEESVPSYKYYTSIKIEQGDTLWSIAEEYISHEYESIYDYIRELKQINNLTSDIIIAGQNITVAYYSDVYK